MSLYIYIYINRGGKRIWMAVFLSIYIYIYISINIPFLSVNYGKWTVFAVPLLPLEVWLPYESGSVNYTITDRIPNGEYLVL